LAEKRYVEELDVQTDEADHGPEDECHERYVGKNGRVKQRASLGGLHTHFHDEDGNEQCGERHESENADRPSETDLWQQAVENNRVDDT